MDQTLSILAVVLIALLVGASVPVLIQLHLTLKRAREFMDSTGRRADRALDEVTETSARIGRLAAGLEVGAGDLRVLMESLGTLGRSAREVQETLHVALAAGRAVAPAVVAAARVLFSRTHDDGKPAGESEGAGAEPAGPRSAVPAPPEEPSHEVNDRNRSNEKRKEVSSHVG